ncbi:hypothetical protein ACQJBY_070323 [Aegilops geniculata]
MLTIGLRLAAEKGARFASNMEFLAIADEDQLHGELLAQQFPARPTAQVQAFARVMAACLAVKLNEEYLIPRCVECLVGGRAPIPGDTPDSSPDGSPDRHDDDYLVAAATEGLAKVDLSDDATVRVRYGKGKPRHAASGRGGEVDKALDYLYLACRMTSLAVKHIEVAVAVAVLSRFIDPKDAARLAESSDKYAYISEEGPYPSSD